MTRPTLLSLNNYYYHRGGAEAVFLGHNRIFEDRGWQAIPFCMKHPKNLASEWSGYFVDEIELGHDYSTLQRLQKAPKTIYSFEAQRKVSRLIADARPDICHAHNIYHHISPSVFSSIKKAGIPIVLTLHDLKIVCPAYKMLNSRGICEDCKGGNLFNVVKNRCIRESTMLSGLVYLEAVVHRFLDTYSKYVDRFIVPSRFFEDKLVEWGIDPRKLRHVPNFIEPSGFDHAPPERVSNEFVYVGRLANEKGVHTLIEAAARTGLPLRIVGTGPEEQNLHRHAQALGASNVTFTGHLSGGELHRVIAECRAMVLPSEWYENAPISVLEAYALGKPVIASRIGGLAELVADGETGFLFKSGSVASLADALTSCADDSDQKILAMGKEAHRRVIEEHSPPAYYARVIEIYDELLNR